MEESEIDLVSDVLLHVTIPSKTGLLSLLKIKQTLNFIITKNSPEIDSCLEVEEVFSCSLCIEGIILVGTSISSLLQEVVLLEITVVVEMVLLVE